MGRIFLSHSSADNAAAIALSRWLDGEGWNDHFLDLDPERGIAAGERWERALNEAAHRCQAVVFLVSRAWLSSNWCQRELQLAHRLDKHIFGVLIDEDVAIEDVPPKLKDHWQLVNLAGGRDHGAPVAVSLPGSGEAHVSFSRSGLMRLRTGLEKAEIDARFFAWPPRDDPDRPPWRGMRPLEAEDAGIFYGREAPIIAVLDRLRGLREAAPPRFLAILGASGAGKSSFLRAGILPRLSRDGRNFLALPVLRPERTALSGRTGLATGLTAALKAQGLKTTRAAVDAAIAGGAEPVGALLEALVAKARMPALGADDRPQPPTLVLAIDQAEELFQAEGREEASALLLLLADLLARDEPKLVALVTIRSDSYERLQVTPELEGVRQTAFSLPPLPRGAYQTVIEGPPARLAGTPRELKIEPALTARLLEEIEAGGAKDSLPLLAFALEGLYDRHGGDGDLTLAEFAEMGGVAGSIDAAVARVFSRAAADPAVPRDHEARLALMRRAMIPWLAGIDPETGSPRRQVARLSEVPQEARPLVAHMVAERLLATERVFEVDGGDALGLVGAGETTVEPAHEALLRQWGLLKGWLAEDAAQLSALEAVARATRDWEANARNTAWLSHQAGRLEDAERLAGRPDLWAKLGAPERAYLAECRRQENFRRDRELEEARKLAEAQRLVVARTRMGAFVATLLAAAASGAAHYGFQNARIAEQRLDTAVATSEAMVREIAVEFGKQTSTPIGLVHDVLRKATDLLDALGAEAGNPDVVASKARALVETGYALRALGDLQAARAVAEEAGALIDLLAKSRPSTDRDEISARVARLAGDVEQESANPARAIGFFETEVMLRQRLAQFAPADLQRTRELALAYNRFADALVRTNRRREALPIYERQLELRRRLLAVDQSSATLRRDLAVSLLKVGDMLRDRADTEQARSRYLEALEVSKAIHHEAPEQWEYARDLAVMLERLGDLDQMDGEIYDAKARFLESTAIREDLVGRNADRVGWVRELAVAYDRLGRIHMEDRRFHEARQNFERALKIRTGLLDKDGENNSRLHDPFVSWINLGDLDLQSGDMEAAKSQFRRALAASAKMQLDHQAIKEFDIDHALAIAKLAEAGDSYGLREISNAERRVGESIGKQENLSPRSRAALNEIRRILSIVDIR